MITWIIFPPISWHFVSFIILTKLNVLKLIGLPAQGWL